MSSDWKNLNDRGTNINGWAYWHQPLYRDRDNAFNYHSATPPNWHPCTSFGTRIIRIPCSPTLH
jgi:hypothetical protein